MSFMPVFGGSSIAPSNQTYLALNMTANVALIWALEQQNGTGEPIANQIDFTATAGLSIALPTALQGSKGFAILFTNLGANTVTIKDFDGNTVASIASGLSWFIYLRDNSTTAGVWGLFEFGAGVSTANAASLVGFGIKAIGSTLNQSMPIQAKNADYVITANDRASLIMWTGGAGNFDLPDPATAATDWFVAVRNSGSGSITVTPPSGTIDGIVDLLVQPGESCLVVTDGVNFYTIGFGQNQNSQFDYISLDVSGTGSYVLAGVQLNRISYNLTGVLTGNRNIIVPATVQQYWVQNNTTGGFTLTVKTALGVGVVVPQGESAIMFCDGTNVINAALNGVPTTRIISAGAGLTGGGDLSADRSFAVSMLGIQTLVDPGADRIYFWDDSLGSTDWLQLGAGLSIAGNVLSASGVTPIVTSAAASIAAIIVGQSAYVFKAADTSRNTTTVTAADPALQLVNIPIGKYVFEGYISYFQNSGAAQGIKFKLASGFSGGPIQIVSGPDATAPIADWQTANRIQGIFNALYTQNVGASVSESTLCFRGYVAVGAADTLSFDWAQETSNANNTTVLTGSWLKVTRLS